MKQIMPRASGVDVVGDCVQTVRLRCSSTDGKFPLIRKSKDAQGGGANEDKGGGASLIILGALTNTCEKSRVISGVETATCSTTVRLTDTFQLG